jgi:hypothetical protein
MSLKPPRKPTGPGRRLWRAIGVEPLRLGREVHWLLLLSAADLLTTYALLRQGVRFYEAHPIAQWCFARWNIAGMAGFKFVVIALVIVAAEVVERERPGRGRLVVGAGALAAGAVFVYGVLLYTRHVGPLGGG